MKSMIKGDIGNWFRDRVSDMKHNNDRRKSSKKSYNSSTAAVKPVTRTAHSFGTKSLFK
jgi:hypothetical protein